MEEIRTFIAIELSQENLARMGDIQARMRDAIPSGMVRWTHPEGMHLTLKFLGKVPSARIVPIVQAMETTCASYAPFSFSIAGLGCFPDTHRPRVVWVGVHEPTGALLGLQRDIERAMKPLGFEPEGRPFSPHLTLGRIKEQRRDGVDALARYIASSAVQIGAQSVTDVYLMRSDLRPSGAVYTELARAPLLA